MKGYVPLYMAKCNNQEYFSVDPSKFVDERPLTFDVFLYLPLNNRIILVRKNGEVLELSARDHFQKHGLKYFHIRNEDTEAYTQYMSAQATPAPAAEFSAEPPEKREAPKAPKTNDVSELDFGAEPPAQQKAPEPEEPEKEFVPEKAPDKIIAGLLDEKKAAQEKAKEETKVMVKKIMASVKNSPLGAAAADAFDNPNAEHATNVAIYGTLFALGLGKKDQRLLQDIIIACLLHDIGITQILPEALSEPETKRTPQHFAEFQKHVALGVELAKELGYSPSPRVLKLLDGHHEKFNGTGYPNHLESFRVDDTAQIIGFADLLDSICRGRYDGTFRDMPEALIVMSQIEKNTSFPVYFNPDIFKKIMNWLKSGTGKDYMEIATTSVEQAKDKLLKAS